LASEATGPFIGQTGCIVSIGTHGTSIPSSYTYVMTIITSTQHLPAYRTHG